MLRIWRSWKFEREIRDVLRRIARQRVGMVLPNSNGPVLVIEYGMKIDERSDCLVRTAYMRGWVIPLQEGVPNAEVTSKGAIKERDKAQQWRNQIHWGLTSAGWEVIHRSHSVMWWTFWVALATLFATVFPGAFSRFFEFLESLTHR